MGVKAGIGWIWCSADVIRSLRLRFDLCLRTCTEICFQTWRHCIFEFVSRNCAANLVQDGDAVERVYICVPVESFRLPLGTFFGFFTARLEVLDVFKATTATNTQLHCLSSLYAGYTHQVQTKARAYLEMRLT